MIGRTLGNFRIVSKLGDGGMGSVYRATDEMLDREVALKVLKPELSRQAALIERFRLEAIALARLNHPRIAALHGLERHGEELVMVMEFLPGETLESIVQRSGRIAWSRAAELCIDILEALDHAHDKGVVHRDIKPANAMLTRDGRVKVMDFGIARLKDKNRQTRMGHAVGTPMYMSPEQLRGEEVDGRADLYAVGAVLFELVTGRMAFEADSDYGLMMKQLNDPPPSCCALVADVPAAIDVIVATAMAKRKEERYGNAVAMRDALKRALGMVTAETRRPRTPAPETRLTNDAMASTADHALPASASPPATRLQPDAAAPQAWQRPDPGSPETRLAGAGAPATRLAGPGATTADTGDGDAAHWTRDWRTWTAAAGLLFAIGLAMRTFSSEPRQVDTRDSAVTVPPVAQKETPPVGPAPTPANQVAVAQDTAAQSQASPPQASPPQASPPNTVVQPPPSVPPVNNARPGAGSTGRTVKGGGGDGRTPAASPRPTRDTSRAQAPVVPTVITPPPTEEKQKEPAARDDNNEAAALQAVSAAIDDFAGAVGSRNVGAVQGVLRGDGDFASTFVSLMREGRLQMSISGQPSVALNGAQASARFSTSLNVRSPFGANRRRSASFSAELARSGSSWRLVSVRPTGTVDLK